MLACDQFFSTTNSKKEVGGREFFGFPQSHQIEISKKLSTKFTKKMKNSTTKNQQVGTHLLCSQKKLSETKIDSRFFRLQQSNF